MYINSFGITNSFIVLEFRLFIREEIVSLNQNFSGLI